MLIEVPSRCGYREAVIVLLLTVLAFSIRLYRVDFNSLSEDEVAKWTAVQEYRHGHFVGVNSEHPMLPKMLAWASLTAGESWSRVATTHHWPSLRPEGWLRLPNAILGAASTATLFFLCRRMMGVAGSFAASFFWAVAPLPVALNRLTKEETPLTFFTLLACYFYCSAQQADAGRTARRWYDLSAISFGLGLASQYILHLLGLNALVWLLAGRMGLNHKPSQFRYGRFFLVMLLAFVVVNPVILCPANFNAILHWLHHDGVKHTGYDFDGRLYMNFPSRLLAGVPWFYYLWLVLVKTPIPILVAVIVGSLLLLRDRRTLASCFFLSLGVVQLAGLSVSGAKWIRYSLPLLPFLYLAGGYAVQQTLKAAKGKVLRQALVGSAAVILLGWPLVELQSWAPYYSFYLNSIGGERQNIARYFAMDEVSEFDTREVAQKVCPFTPAGATVATARPMSMAYYLQACGRWDLQIVPLYDTHYAPRDGDLIVLEPSRRFFETQRFFDALGNSAMPHGDISVGPVLASTIYLFDASVPGPKSGEEELTLTQSHGGPPRFENDAQEHASIDTSRFDLSDLTRETHTMTPLYHPKKSDGRWFVRAIALLIIGFPAVAQQTSVSAPLSADEVMGRVVQMNEARAKALESYSSVRRYHLECHCLSHKKADMVVRTDYQAPNKKTFTIVSESGSGTVRERVFKKLLEAEQESMRDENQQRSAITPENYTFQLSDYEKTSADEFYVLDAQPRSKNKFLFRGRIWVGAKDFAITRVEGEPAVNPSWWTVKTDFERRYQKIGDFWLPESNESETKVRVFGTAVLSIEYCDYQITQAGGATVASPQSEALAATLAPEF